MTAITPLERAQGNVEPADDNSKPGHSYTNITSEASATQLQRDQNAEGSTINTGMRHVYDGLSARGESFQVNGNLNSVEAIKAFYKSRK